MTEEVAAPAPAEPVVESEATEQVTEQPEQDEAPKRSRTAREAVERAFGGGTETVPTAEEKAQAEAKENAVKPEAKAEPKESKPRAPDGKFAAKEAEAEPAKEPAKADKFSEAPSRFSEDAKKEWAKAPEPVRAEIQRAISENEKGLKQYQAAFEPIKPFMKLAGNDPQKLAGAMQRYVNTENTLRQDPVRGFTEIARNLGLSPEQVGRALLGQQPGQADPRDKTIHQLQQQVQQLTQQTGQIDQSMRMSQQMQTVQQFAASHPRFDELADEMATMLQTKYARDLEDAYTKAERLNPAPAPEPEPAPALPAQTRPARSLTGAPSPGSNPATNRAPSKNPRDALRRHLFG